MEDSFKIFDKDTDEVLAIVTLDLPKRVEPITWEQRWTMIRQVAVSLGGIMQDGVCISVDQLDLKIEERINNNGGTNNARQ